MKARGITAAFTCMGVCAAVLCAQDNVLIIVADDLGVDNVRVYGEGGSGTPPTPNIDALAARGVLFRNAWSNPVCSPTRAALMTGRYAFRTGVGTALPGPSTLPPPGELSLDEVTLPELLDAGGSGYSHAAIGKWHLGDQLGPLTPNASGWSHYAGLLGGLCDYFSWPRTVNGSTQLSTTYSTTQMVDDALAWIGTQSGPWVCYLAFNAPHSPYHAPPQHLHSRDLSGAGDPAENPKPYFKAMVQAMDTEIGRVLASLGPTLARTNVIFVGDNGTANRVTRWPFVSWHAKGFPYEGGVNVPLIVAGPAVSAPGRSELALVSTVDLFSTVADLAGFDARSVVSSWVSLDSVSFVSLLQNPGSPPPRSTVFSELFFGSTYGRIGQSGFATIRNDRYKLISRYSEIWGGGGTGFPYDEFYDLQQDPFEKVNLLASPLTALEQQNYDALGDDMTRLMRPVGTLAVFGVASCAGSNGNPAISGSLLPTVGGTYEVRVDSAARSSPATMIMGVSHERWQGISLPLQLSSLGTGPNCYLYTSIDASAATRTDATGAVTVAVAVPYNLALVGKTIFHTWWVLDPGAPGGASFTTSNGAAAVIGTTSVVLATLPEAGLRPVESIVAHL